MSEEDSRPEPRSDWGKAVQANKEYVLVGPGHELYSFHPHSRAACMVCDEPMSQYLCPPCQKVMCRLCCNAHLKAVHKATLVTMKIEREIVLRQMTE